MTKAAIRAQIAGQRPDFQILEKMSATIVQKLQTLELFSSARAVGAYMPLADEVDIAPLFKSLEKTFYIPAFDNASGGYRMARLTAELKKGQFAIHEPAVPVFAAKDELDLIIVPGVAFDHAGRRIGRGGGFYDRLLPQYRTVRAGICFDFQCLEVIPAEEHDVRMNWVVTETQILNLR
jgi:5-formyltetrahydrofolate cyclo-ligase